MSDQEESEFDKTMIIQPGASTRTDEPEVDAESEMEKTLILKPGAAFPGGASQPAPPGNDGATTDLAARVSRNPPREAPRGESPDAGSSTGIVLTIAVGVALVGAAVYFLG